MRSSEYNSSRVYFLMGRFTPTFTEHAFFYRQYVLTNNGISGIELDGSSYVLENNKLNFELKPTIALLPCTQISR